MQFAAARASLSLTLGSLTRREAVRWPAIVEKGPTEFADDEHVGALRHALARLAAMGAHEREGVGPPAGRSKTRPVCLRSPKPSSRNRRQRIMRHLVLLHRDWLTKS